MAFAKFYFQYITRKSEICQKLDGCSFLDEYTIFTDYLILNCKQVIWYFVSILNQVIPYSKSCSENKEGSDNSWTRCYDNNLSVAEDCENNTRIIMLHVTKDMKKKGSSYWFSRGLLQSNTKSDFVFHFWSCKTWNHDKMWCCCELCWLSRFTFSQKQCTGHKKMKRV